MVKESKKDAAVKEVKEAVKATSNAVKEVAEAAKAVVDLAEYELVELIGSAQEKINNHIVYLKNYRVEFVNGVAKVRKEVADILRKMGLVK